MCVLRYVLNCEQYFFIFQSGLTVTGLGSIYCKWKFVDAPYVEFKGKFYKGVNDACSFTAFENRNHYVPIWQSMGEM
jgi:hypothetical protein